MRQAFAGPAKRDRRAARERVYPEGVTFEIPSSSCVTPRGGQRATFHFRLSMYRSERNAGWTSSGLDYVVSQCPVPLLRYRVYATTLVLRRTSSPGSVDGGPRAFSFSCSASSPVPRGPRDRCSHEKPWYESSRGPRLEKEAREGETREPRLESAPSRCNGRLLIALIEFLLSLRILDGRLD